MKWAVASVGVVAVIFSVWTAIENKRFRYNKDHPLSEIKGINVMDHEFSIVVIKDTFNEYANRYLLRYDPRWECFLFPYFRTQEIDDKENITKRQSDALHIPEADISVEHKLDSLIKKYSESDHYEKYYMHRYYIGHINKFGEEHKRTVFRLDGTDYRWMSYDEMMEDERIRKVNKDVIEFVKNRVA